MRGNKTEKELTIKVSSFFFVQQYTTIQPVFPHFQNVSLFFPIYIYSTYSTTVDKL